MNESEHVHWVRMQADCLLQRLFANLYKVVEADVEDANNYSPFAEKQFTFTMDPSKELGQRSRFIVERLPPQNSPIPNAVASFVYRHDKNDIFIERLLPSHENLKHLHVEAQWDAETDTCGIIINGKRNAKGEFFKPWQISREALSPLIFP